MEVELDLSNYAIKADLKNVTGKSKFTKKADLASVKYDVDMLDIDKLEKVPTGLNSSKSKVDKLDVDKLVPAPVKLSDKVKNDFVKKIEYDELVQKVNAIPTTETSNLVKKLTMTKKLVKLKKKVLIMIIVISI